MLSLSNLTIKSTREIPIQAWPPSGNWSMCARLYVNTTEDHICMNTVSWYFDGGSAYTYSDANCTDFLYDLSQWNDFTPNTYLPISGEDSNGKYVNIFTNAEGGSIGNPWDFCVILGNEYQASLTDDSWEIIRVDVIAANSNIYYSYNNPDSPYKGQWLRDNTESNWTTHQVSGGGGSITVVRPIGLYIPEPAPAGYKYYLWYVEEDNYGEFQQQDFGISTDGEDRITGATCLAGKTSSNPGNENYPNGFDGNDNTKWYSGNTYPNWAIFTYNEDSYLPVGFWYMTGNDHVYVPFRAPSKYKLCGSNTQTTNPSDSSWITLIDTTSTGDSTFRNINTNLTWVYKSL